MTPIQVTMLGEFSLSCGGQTITGQASRSRNGWLLLAYFLCHQNRSIPQEELIGLLYGNEPQGANPGNALKTALHRVRALLEPLWPGAGRELIVRQGVGYRWNPECPARLDIHEFDRLCQAADDPGQEGPDGYLRALELYRGEFLGGLSSEPWVLPLAAYFHNQAIHAAQRAIPMLADRGRAEEAEALCRRMLVLEPYHEALHSRLMRLLLDQGKHREAAALYESLSQRLFDEFGVMPSEEILTLYREAVRTTRTHTLPMDMILERLKESGSASGALVCEYDYFVVLCRAEARSMARDGKAAHIALLSVTDARDSDLDRRSLERTMDNLEDQIRTNLRRGDALTRCSVSQFLIMLPRASYENSCMVCRRILNAFARRYPNSPAKLRFTVQPLEPNL